MDERKEVLIVCLILLILGVIGFFATLLWYTEFNFNKAELSINENNVSEKLYYHTDKQYHTLFRNFETSVIVNKTKLAEETYYSQIQGGDLIEVNTVECDKGTSYAKEGFYYFIEYKDIPLNESGIFSGNKQSGYAKSSGYDCVIFPEEITRADCPYTEPNEYGCTFGNAYGFNQGEDYWIRSDFTLNPKTLFKINGKYYIKFVAYSGGNHKRVVRNKNLILNKEVISKSDYFYNEDVILYLPYTLNETAEYNIIEKKDFEFDSNNIGWIAFLSLFPTIIFFGIWFFFGRENLKSDLPPEMSFYPRERKGWEVAAYFNPPFSEIDRNFFATMMLDFYRRKIIDTKMRDKAVYIKINKDVEKGLDKVENDFLQILKTVQEKCRDKYKMGDYFNLKGASSSFFPGFNLEPILKILQKHVKEEGKSYIDKTGTVLLVLCFISLMLISGMFIVTSSVNPIVVIAFLLISLGIASFVGRTSSLLIHFKGEYYQEYEHWQSFKRFMKHSSLKLHGHKGVAIWQQHLVYAAALGVAKKVLKELKDDHLITEQQYNLYNGTFVMSSSFAASSGVGAHGGGVGGGGIGGGGGGGR